MSPSWVAGIDDSGFSLHNLPYGIFSQGKDGPRRAGTRVGDFVLDLAAIADEDRLPEAPALRDGTLNTFMAMGPEAHRRVRRAVVDRLTDPVRRGDTERHLRAARDVTLHLPVDVADYVDFYASEHHATNLGRIFRPEAEPLLPNWKHMPVGYHGRAGTVVVSGTPVVRPSGQVAAPAEADPQLVPTRRLDFEAEVGFVVGIGSPQGSRVSMSAFPNHVFGVCLVNDWSARDIQAWEYVPLGPFLGKSFCTSVSPWVVPLDALEHARVRPPERSARPLPYLDDEFEPAWGLDVRVEVEINGQIVSRPPFASMYWTAAQQLAHMTVNGASLRTGDLYASGTVSGPEPGEVGSLIELTWGGTRPLHLPDGSRRTFLQDGDEVVIRANAPGPDGFIISLGDVAGRIVSSAG